MFELFRSWEPGQVIGFVAVVGTFLTLIVITLGGYWLSARNASLLADQKREYLERGLSLDDIERLLRSPAENPSPRNAQEADAQLVAVLVENEVPAKGIQQVMEMFRSLDAGSKPAVAESIESMLESGAEEDQLVAAVRTLCMSRQGATI